MHRPLFDTATERVAKHAQSAFAGTLRGRNPLASPLDGDGRGAGFVSAVGGTDIHHITLQAVTGQTITAGGATVVWGTELDEPTERRGFNKAHTELTTNGQVVAIPVDLTGVGEVGIRIPFTADATGTCTIQHIRGTQTLTIVESTGTGPALVGGKHGIDFENGDEVRVYLDLDADAVIDDSGDDPFIEITIDGAASPTSPPEWDKIASISAWGIHFDGASWWTTAGATDTVTEYDGNWTQQSSFTTGWDRTRGVTMLAGSLWLTGDGTTTEPVGEFSTGGALQSSFTTGSASDGNAGLASDGTTLWLLENAAKVLENYDTAGTLLDSFALPAGVAYSGVAIYNGRLHAVDNTNAQLLVFETDGTPVQTVDLSGATSSPTGVWIDASGTLYVSTQAGGVWRRRARL